MLRQVVFLSALAICLMKVTAISLDKLTTEDSSEEKKSKDTLESLKEFVRIVDKYNLNVSVIGSHKKYGSSGTVKKSISLAFHMPVNNEHLTEATLISEKQDKYLDKLKKLGAKEHVGAKTRVIQIQNGTDKLDHEQSVNSQYIVDSPSYEFLTKYKNGVAGFTIPDNETSETVHNFIIRKPSNEVKSVHVITANVILNEIDVSEDFSADVLSEIKQILPKLWLSIGDETILSRLLVEHLDNKFDGNFQVLIGVEKFAIGTHPYANLEVADTKVLVFSLP